MRPIKMPVSNLNDRIRRYAYLLWEQEGRHEGRAEDHWFRAEAEVTALNRSEEAPPGTPGAGENICPACEGTGRLGRKRCSACGGSGRMIDVLQP